MFGRKGLSLTILSKQGHLNPKRWGQRKFRRHLGWQRAFTQTVNFLPGAFRYRLPGASNFGGIFLSTFSDGSNFIRWGQQLDCHRKRSPLGGRAPLSGFSKQATRQTWVALRALFNAGPPSVLYETLRDISSGVSGGQLSAAKRRLLNSRRGRRLSGTVL